MKNIKPILTCLVAALAIACSGDNNDNENNVTTNNGTAPNNGTTPTTGVDATCADYCDSITASCSGTDSQYDDNGICLDYCNNISKWAPGKVGATDGNTVACRLYHAGVAGTMDAETHCPHAGPSGAGVCGSYCETYCGLMGKNCDSTYSDDAACMTACGDFAETGNPGDVKYDTVQCRIYHAGAPAATDGATHCPHAGEEPTAACIGQPTDFTFRTDAPTEYTRVDRVGMPAISTAVITDKDAYNDSNPAGDAASTFVPEIVANLVGLHAALDDDLTGLNLTPCTVTPMTGAGTCVAQAAPLVIPDTLKIDPTVPAGFPNGRRLADPVMDITLAVILLDLSAHPVTFFADLPLNPTENDKGVEGAFLTTFPYLHAPHTPAP